MSPAQTDFAVGCITGAGLPGALIRNEGKLSSAFNGKAVSQKINTHFLAE